MYEKFCSFLYGNVKLIWGWCLIWIIVMHFIQLWVSVKRIAVFAVMVCCGTSCNSCAIDSMLVFSDRLAGASVLVSCEEVVAYLMSYVSCDEILQCIWSVGIVVREMESWRRMKRIALWRNGCWLRWCAMFSNRSTCVNQFFIGLFGQLDWSNDVV